MKKKLLLVTDVMQRGGIDTYTISLAREAKQRGWEIEGMVDPSTRSLIPKAFQSIGRIHQGALYHRSSTPQAIRAFVKEALGKSRPTFVHFSCGVPWSCISAREAVIEEKLPFVFTEHYFPPDFLSDPTWIARQKRIEEFYGFARGVVFVSAEQRDRFLRQISWIPPNPTWVIPNGIDVEGSQQQALPIEMRIRHLRAKIVRNEPFRLLCMGRLVPQKGIDLAIRALKNLSDRWTLDIWGEGPQLQILKELVSQSCLDSLVHFYPWKEGVLSLFSNYDLFLFPSREEGLPFTFLEALASGIPVIASDLPVHQKISQGGRWASLFESENVGALSGELQKWFRRPWEKSLLAKGRFDWLARHFNQKRVVRRTLKIFENEVDNFRREVAAPEIF